MAKAPKLKVFRTPIGFHDAYVAAPSQKAALKAWGADSNLFASGSAELVDDPELTREPLAKPGEVIRRLRGTLAEHVAALPRKAKGKSRGAKAASSAARSRGREQPTPAPAPKPKPRPARTSLDRAEAALEALEERQRLEQAELRRRQAEIEAQRRKLDAKHDREREKLAQRLDAARDTYDRAMRAWRES